MLLQSGLFFFSTGEAPAAQILAFVMSGDPSNDLTLSCLLSKKSVSCPHLDHISRGRALPIPLGLLGWW